MKNKAKFSKTIDDEQLDQVTGGVMTAENPAVSKVPDHIIDQLKKNSESYIHESEDNLEEKINDVISKNRTPIT